MAGSGGLSDISKICLLALAVGLRVGLIPRQAPGFPLTGFGQKPVHLSQ